MPTCPGWSAAATSSINFLCAGWKAVIFSKLACGSASHAWLCQWAHTLYGSHLVWITPCMDHSQPGARRDSLALCSGHAETNTEAQQRQHTPPTLHTPPWHRWVDDGQVQSEEQGAFVVQNGCKVQQSVICDQCISWFQA